VEGEIHRQAGHFQDAAQQALHRVLLQAVQPAVGVGGFHQQVGDERQAVFHRHGASRSPSAGLPRRSQVRAGLSRSREPAMRARLTILIAASLLAISGHSLILGRRVPTRQIETLSKTRASRRDAAATADKGLAGTQELNYLTGRHGPGAQSSSSDNRQRPGAVSPSSRPGTATTSRLRAGAPAGGTRNLRDVKQRGGGGAFSIGLSALLVGAMTLVYMVPR
jgi:hypothetical protein